MTQGCEKWLDVIRHKTLAAAVAGLRGDGFALYAAVPGAPVALDDLDFSRPAAVMVGNEHDGLTAEAIAAADVRFGIPMHGLTQSLNLSVATALIAERASTLRRSALGAPTDLDRRRHPGAARPVLCRVGPWRRRHFGARGSGFLNRPRWGID